MWQKECDWDEDELEISFSERKKTPRSVKLGDESSGSEEESEEGKTRNEKSDKEEVDPGIPQLSVPGLLETVMEKFQSKPNTPVVSKSGGSSGFGERTSKVNLLTNSSW